MRYKMKISAQVKLPSLTKGFSLIELMMVISIVSLISAIAIPKFYDFKAKAARGEVFINLSHAHMLVDSYKEDRHPGSWGLTIEYGVKFDSWSPRTETPTSYNVHCLSNVVGFATTNCQKLRYFYNINLMANSTFTGASDPWDDIRATNSTGIALGYHYGSSGLIPLNFCGTSGYVDIWSKLDGILIHTVAYKSFCF